MRPLEALQHSHVSSCAIGGSLRPSPRSRRRLKVWNCQNTAAGGAGPVRVCVIGGGAAGLSAAWSLSRHPQFSAEVWDAGDAPGGVAATVIELGNGLFVNEQVQGGFQHSYANTLLLFKELGVEPQAVWPGVRLSVGTRGTPDYWDNFSPELPAFPVLQRHAAEIARFHKVTRFLMGSLGQSLGLLPLGWLLSVLRFSKGFQQEVLYPLVVTLNGTGNQMAGTPCAVVASILRHPLMRVFAAGSEAEGTLLASVSQGPQMITFPHLRRVYERLAQRINSAPGCAVRCGTPVTDIRYQAGGAESGRWLVSSAGGQREAEFDKVVFACGPESTLRLLEVAGVPDHWLYRFVLTSYNIYDATIITHTDARYIRENYGVPTDKPGDLPFWMVRWAREMPGNPGGLPQAELSYALSAGYNHLDKTDEVVYQTTLVDSPGIDPQKVISRRTARHVALSPASLTRGSLALRLIQGRHDALFAGAFTMGNPHEAAVVTGLVAAERLGAPFPFRDPDADAAYHYALFKAIVFGQGSIPRPIDFVSEYAA